MELHEKEEEKDYKDIGKLFRKTIKKKCLLILDLKPLRSLVKGKHYAAKEFESKCTRKEIVDVQILITSKIITLLTLSVCLECTDTEDHTKLTPTFPKSTIETLEKGVKYVQS